MKKAFLRFDKVVIDTTRSLNVPLTRFALFVIYFWFGFLKIIGQSPANPLVAGLLEKTLPFVTFNQFIVFFGLLEMLIGVLFLIPRLERIAIIIFFGHMITTIMPMFLLPEFAWQGFMIPTLEGQYMIKNIALIALAVNLGAHLKARES